jgi:hypothetical protein
LGLTFWGLIGAASVASAAEIVTVAIDTSAWQGSDAELAFDLVGEGSPSNIVDITSFLTDGTLGIQTPTGAEFGTLPGTVTMQTSPSSFFNEDLADITLGSYLYFQFQARTNVGPLGAFPDEFSFFILDDQGNPLVTTSDPTGSDAIATIDLTGDPQPLATSYSSDVTLTQGTAPPPGNPSVVVPEPASWSLLAGCLGLLALMTRQRKLGARLAALLLAAGSAFAQNSPPGLLGEDGWISVQNSGLRLNRATNTFDSTVTLVNLNSQPIQGPFYLGVSGITNSNVSLANSAGMILEHIPYIALSTPAQLPVGQPVVAGILKFSNPSMGGFQFNTGVWDAVSLGIPVNMSCPNVPVPAAAGDGNHTYSTPTDNYGRLASCVPASGSYFPIGSTLVQCVTGGTGSQYAPGYCNFNYTVDPPPVISGGVNLAEADLSLGPCQQVFSTPSGEIILSGGTYNENLPCVEPANGTSSFSIANNGLYTATNVVLEIGVPKDFVSAFSMQFSQASTCQDIGPGKFADGTTFTQGDILSCTFDSLNAGDMIQATVGYDTPPASGGTSMWTLNAYVTSDTPDPDTTNNAIGFAIYYPHRVVFPPVPPSCTHDPDDHTFEVLLDTCGVPPLAVEIVTGVFLGAATMVTGAGEAGIVTGVLDVETNTLFRCAAAQVLHLINPVDDPEL